MARHIERCCAGGLGRLGQAIPEMALLMPLFLLLAVGILDFGRVFYDYERIQNAAREGAMWLAYHPPADPDDAVADVTPRVQGEGIDCAGGAVQVTGAEIVTISVNGVDQREAQVMVSCDFVLVSAYMGRVLNATDGTITLHGRARMPVT